MSSTKLIRHYMGNVAPPPAGTTQERLTDPALIKALLIAKGHEELQEIATASSRDALLAELGDLYEVLISLALMHGWDMPDLRYAASRKADLRGPLLMTGPGGDHRRPIAMLHRVGEPE